MGTLIGIDGCRAGWMVAEADASLRRIDVRIEATIGDVFARARAGRATVVVDIPIGLPGRQPRIADALARERLGPHRRSSVFSAPCRVSLSGSTYREACILNSDASNRQLSKQSYNLLPKIREVDALMTPALQKRVREGHPEVVFAELAGLPHGLAQPKKSAQGAALRRRLLESRITMPDIGGLLSGIGTQNAGADDIIDALACLIAAQRVARGEALVLPAVPEYDTRGLRMEIVG